MVFNIFKKKKTDIVIERETVKNVPLFEKEMSEIIEHLKNKYGLKNTPISLFPYNENGNQIKKSEDGESIEIGVYLQKCSQLDNFKANAAHELWHVKTNLDLIAKIGIDEFLIILFLLCIYFQPLIEKYN